MFQRVAIAGITFLLLFSGNLEAGGKFPSTAEDYAALYEMQMYRQFQGNAAEYRRRIELSKQVLKGYKKSRKSANETIAIQWFRTASQSGFAPAVPAFSSTNLATQSTAPAADKFRQPADQLYRQPAAQTFRQPARQQISQAIDLPAPAKTKPIDTQGSGTKEERFGAQPVQPEYDWQPKKPADKTADFPADDVANSRAK